MIRNQLDPISLSVVKLPVTDAGNLPVTFHVTGNLPVSYLRLTTLIPLQFCFVCSCKKFR